MLVAEQSVFTSQDTLAQTERDVALGWSRSTKPSVVDGKPPAEKKGEAMSARETFLTDIKEIRRRAREHLSDGAVTQNYGGKVDDAIALLNHAVATEIVCILRYKFHAVCATGLASKAVKEEFAQHAKEEEEHLDLLVSHEGRPMLEE